VARGLFNTSAGSPHVLCPSRTFSYGTAFTEGAGQDEGIRPVDSNSMAPSPAGSPAPQRPGTESVLTLAGGVLAGVGGVFVGTHSILVTVVAAVAAIVLTAMVLTVWR
jgi:hypothetical protein